MCAVQEVAAFGGQGAVIFDQPAQRGSVDRLGMCALADLRQLLRIAEQKQAGGRRGDGDGVGQTELAGFVDHQQVQTSRRNPVRVGEVPGGTADHASCCAGDESGVFLLVDLLPPDVSTVGSLLGHAQRIDTGGDRAAEQVLHHGMRLRDDADSPAVLGDQPGDDARGGVGLAGSGWPVHRHVGRIQVEQGGGDVVGSVAVSGKVGAAAGPGPAAQQDVEHRGAGELRQPGANLGRRRFDCLPQRLGSDRRPGRQRERELVESAAVRGGSFEKDHLGRHARIIDRDDLGPAGRASIGIVGQPGRGGRLVERVDICVGVDRAARQFAGQLQPALQLLRAWRLMPIDRDVCLARR